MEARPDEKKDSSDDFFMNPGENSPIKCTGTDRQNGISAGSSEILKTRENSNNSGVNSSKRKSLPADQSAWCKMSRVHFSDEKNDFFDKISVKNYSDENENILDEMGSKKFPNQKNDLMDESGPKRTPLQSNVEPAARRRSKSGHGYDFLKNFTSQFNQAVRDGTIFDELLNQTREMFKIRYRDLLTSAVDAAPSFDGGAQLLDAFRQAWKHSMPAVVEKCALKFALDWSVDNLTSFGAALPPRLLVSVLAAKLDAGQRTWSTNPAHLHSAGHDNPVDQDSSDVDSDEVFYHDVVLNTQKIFCQSCGPTALSCLCSTCPPAHPPSSTARVWCLQPRCLARYEAMGEVVCLTTAYCRKCRAPVAKATGAALPSGRCRCQTSLHLRAEYFRAELDDDGGPA